MTTVLVDATHVIVVIMVWGPCSRFHLCLDNLLLQYRRWEAAKSIGKFLEDAKGAVLQVRCPVAGGVENYNAKRTKRYNLGDKEDRFFDENGLKDWEHTHFIPIVAITLGNTVR